MISTVDSGIIDCMRFVLHIFAIMNGDSFVTKYAYDAWGNVLDESVAVPALATIRYRFQGREWSAATGLANFRMRWYDPETGRWLSKDPIGLSGGLNLYAFCGNESLNVDDPTGLAVQNNSPYIVFVKPENDFCENKVEYSTAGAYPINPGGYWKWGQDGIAIQGYRDNMVYKVPGKFITQFDLIVNKDGTIVQRPGNRFTSEKDCETMSGEWKGLDFLAELYNHVAIKYEPRLVPTLSPMIDQTHGYQVSYVKIVVPDPDHTWDSLFRAVNPRNYRK